MLLYTYACLTSVLVVEQDCPFYDLVSEKGVVSDARTDALSLPFSQIFSAQSCRVHVDYEYCSLCSACYFIFIPCYSYPCFWFSAAWEASSHLSRPSETSYNGRLVAGWEVYRVWIFRRDGTDLGCQRKRAFSPLYFSRSQCRHQQCRLVAR